MPTCVVCSGNDFICESGYYFCSECQTQSQDVREELHENDNAEDEGQPIGGKRKRSRKSTDSCTSKEENMTSWEGFNFALAGLVDELIWLGADPKLKIVVLDLWSRYLRQLEVAFFSKEGPLLPKLGPNFKKYDANIIYGHAVQKRKLKKNCVEEEDPVDAADESSLDPGNPAVERRKVLENKRTAFRKTYEKMIHDMSLTSQTLTDVTLEMLAVSEATCDEGPKELQFSNEAKKTQQIKGSFQFHPGLLVRNKLVCLLYLGLLETNDKINLSDLLRWISEGHVSYRHLSRFFPSEANLQGENHNLFAAHQPSPPYGTVLTAVQHVASYIGLTTLKIPQMNSLILHYIQELNLPAQVGLLAQRLLNLLPDVPNTFPVSLQTVMPNWEGRAMAHIIVALKLLFGLDDATEHRNSRIATRMNKLLTSKNEPLRLFVWDDWICFCGLRRTAIMSHHESYFGKNKLTTSVAQNIDSFVSGWKKRYRSTNMLSNRLGVTSDTHKHVLTRLTDKQVLREDDHIRSSLHFPASLSPYSSYCKIITKAYQDGRVKGNASQWNLALTGLDHDMLGQSFKDMSVDYLTHPHQYIEWAQQHELRIGLHSGSAVHSIRAPKRDSIKCVDGNYRRVKVFLDVVQELPTSTLPLPQTVEGSKQIRKYSCHKPLIFPKLDHTHKKKPLPHISCMELGADSNEKPRTKRGRPKLVKKVYEDLPKEDEDNMLHTPFTEYWTLHFSPLTFPEEAWQLPQSFMQLLEECASLIEMHPSLLYKEVMFLEVLHKDLQKNLCPTQNIINSSDIHVLAGEENRTKWCKQRW